MLLFENSGKLGRASLDRDFLMGPQFLNLKYTEGRLYSAGKSAQITLKL